MWDRLPERLALFVFLGHVDHDGRVRRGDSGPRRPKRLGPRDSTGVGVQGMEVRLGDDKRQAAVAVDEDADEAKISAAVGEVGPPQRTCETTVGPHIGGVESQQNADGCHVQRLLLAGRAGCHPLAPRHCWC